MSIYTLIPEEVEDTPDLGVVIVENVADQTLEQTKNVADGVQTLKTISKFVKFTGIIRTAIDIGVNLYEAKKNYDKGNSKEADKSVIKAGGGILAGAVAAAGYGLASGGLPGLSIAVTVTILWNIFSNWW